MTEPSYVIGNSWQLLKLTAAERSALDRAEWVFVCNCFPQYRRAAGFRPTVWALGDTADDRGCGLLGEQLYAIHADRELKRRLRHLFVCIESEQAKPLVTNCQLPITLYQRGSWQDEHQTFAKSLYQPLFHRSTGIDLLNLAMILNPGGQIRLAGFNRGDHDGYFYTDRDMGSDPEWFPFGPMWDAFQQAYDAGWNILDCCYSHYPKYRDLYTIPQGRLI